MPLPKPDDELLLIRCPSCGQRFKVGDDLRGRTVECGGCQHRFRIHDDVIARGRKFYPGERRDPALDRFQRVPLAIVAARGGADVRYANAPDPATFEPTPPQRILAAFFGAAGMVMMALLLIFGASRGGLLDGMTTGNRLLMAGFTGLLGMVLLMYGNPRARAKAFSVAIIMALGLLALPFFFTTGSVPLRSDVVELPVPGFGVETEDVVKAADTGEGRIGELRAQIGIRPLEDEIARLAREGSSKRAVGLWLRDLREQNRFLIRDYILRTTGADPQTHYYPRGGGDFLMVVTGIDQSLEQMTEVVSPLGLVENAYPELSVIELRVNNEGFREGPIEKLSDRNDPAFYDLNKRELESIDLDRVSKAVKRLAEAEPKVYRSDVTRKLIGLLEAPWVTFKGSVCDALAVWSEQPGPAGEAALKVAKDLHERSVVVPQEMIGLIVKEKNAGVIPLLDGLWSKEPMVWEKLYGDMGAVAEGAVLRRFPETQGITRHSAVRLLERVGGADSLPVLESALADADPELKVLIAKSTSAIQRRMGQ